MARSPVGGTNRSGVLWLFYPESEATAPSANARNRSVDGPLSRILNAASVTGRLLDPVADKAFVFAVLGTLWYEGVLLLWHAALVAARDLTVSAGALALLLFGRWAEFGRIEPTLLGKAVTAGQLLWIMSLLTRGQIAHWLFLPVAILSCLAFLHYLYRFWTRSQ